jgi:hypothetical protein
MMLLVKSQAFALFEPQQLVVKCSCRQRKLKRLKHFKTHVEIGKALCPSILDGSYPNIPHFFFSKRPQHSAF